MDNVDLSKRKTRHRERQSIQRLLFQTNRRKSWWVWFTSKVQLVNPLCTFLVAKDLRIDWKSFKISANEDLWNLPTHQIEWKIHETKCLRNWTQNMVNIETVICALPKILIAWSLPQRIQKQFSNHQNWLWYSFKVARCIFFFENKIFLSKCWIHTSEI